MTLNKLYHYLLIKLRVAIAKTKAQKWDGTLLVEMPLDSPYPEGWVLRVFGFGDRISQLTEFYLLETEGDGELGVIASRLTRSAGHTPILTTLHEILEAPECWDDQNLERAWAVFGDHPYDAERECIEEDFMHFRSGTHREDIWHWFDKRHSQGVHALLYPDEGADLEPAVSQDGPLFTDEEIAFVRKFGAQSEAEAFVKAMNDSTDHKDKETEFDNFSALLYQMVHKCAPRAAEIFADSCNAKDAPFARKVHYIEKHIVEEYTALMTAKSVDYTAKKIPKYATVYSTTVEFGDGYEMDISVCSAIDGQPLWSQAVLYQHGSEIAYTDPDDSLVGIWKLGDDDGRVFVADVRSE